MDLNSVILTTGCSAGFFKLVNSALKRLPTPHAARGSAWKWRNTSTSFVHSLITAIWSVLCFYLHPEMAEDLISTHSVFSHALVSVSIGYFLYDFSDMVLHQEISQCWELLFHHAVVIACFGLAALTRLSLGASPAVALLVEVNSVFLHLRQALPLPGPRPPTPSRLNSMLNLGTYVVFRISTLAWMTRWLVVNRARVPLLSYTLGSAGMAVMTAMNIVLFYRLLRSDFLLPARDGRKEK
ncbi:hypothetical protein AAFF_G00255860 [Aldrovandia affinis]|uniref:TLC domain-containing protein n=1 Tax=Aldrovandia affinis TaxID=143900 RepID=A0AAD7RCU3_9TELE|nr:hypothetical protein AAFF_G00255860 [Aldrovandia affinis]